MKLILRINEKKKSRRWLACYRYAMLKIMESRCHNDRFLNIQPKDISRQAAEFADLYTNPKNTI